MQIVYISIRPKVLSETLIYVENFMPFITEALVITRAELFNQFSHPDRLTLTLIDEKEMLGPRVNQFKQTQDHVEKNWLLRSSIPNLTMLEQDFLLSDDDHRPLQPITLEKFIENGKYNAYYYYDGRKKKRNKTSYDQALRRTIKILQKKHWPTLAYSAHMPQIFNKQFLIEASNAFIKEPNQGILEWEAYFNYCYQFHSDRFNPPKPYETLCWPAYSTDWLLDVKPITYSFENFYPELYKKGGIFYGLSTTYNETEQSHINQQKITRRLQQDSRFLGVVISKNSLTYYLQSVFHLILKVLNRIKKHSLPA